MPGYVRTLHPYSTLNSRNNLCITISGKRRSERSGAAVRTRWSMCGVIVMRPYFTSLCCYCFVYVCSIHPSTFASKVTKCLLVGKL